MEQKINIELVTNGIYVSDDLSINLLDAKGNLKTLPKSITIDAMVSHVGYVNENFYFYDPESAVKAVDSFTKPYRKQVLKHHKMLEDAIGEVIESSYVKLSDSKDINKPNGQIRLKMKIVDQAAIMKFLDRRYKSFSIHASSGAVQCSICGQHPYKCDHQRGQSYLIEEEDKKSYNQLCYWIIKDFIYPEVSVVNVPGDPLNHINNINSEDSQKDGIMMDYQTGLNLDQADKKMVFIDSVELPNLLSNKDLGKHEKIIDKITIKDGKLKNSKQEKQIHNQPPGGNQVDIEKMEEMYDRLNKQLSDQVASTKTDLSDAKETIKTKEEEIITLKQNLSSKETELTDLKDSIETINENTNIITKKAVGYLIDKLVDLKTNMGVEVKKEDREHYATLSMDALDAAIGELENIDIQSLLDHKDLVNGQSINKKKAGSKGVKDILNDLEE